MQRGVISYYIPLHNICFPYLLLLKGDNVIMSGIFSLCSFQTPVDWQSEITNTKENKKKKKHRRSASFTHADKKLNVSYLPFN